MKITNTEDKKTTTYKYRAVITDRLGCLDSKMTRWYTTYVGAHEAGHRLAVKHFVGYRYSISIKLKEVKNG